MELIDHGLTSNPWHVKDQLKLTQYALGLGFSGIPGRPVYKYAEPRSACCVQ